MTGEILQLTPKPLAPQAAFYAPVYEDISNQLRLITSIMTKNNRALKTMLKHLSPLVQERQTNFSMGNRRGERSVSLIPAPSSIHLTSPSRIVYSGFLIPPQ